MFENPRRGRQARNFTTNVPTILDLKSSSKQIFSENCRSVPLTLFTILLILYKRSSCTHDCRAYSDRKVFRLTPVHKKGDHEKIGNYPPSFCLVSLSRLSNHHSYVADLIVSHMFPWTMKISLWTISLLFFEREKPWGRGWHYQWARQKLRSAKLLLSSPTWLKIGDIQLITDCRVNYSVVCYQLNVTNFQSGGWGEEKLCRS